MRDEIAVEWKTENEIETVVGFKIGDGKHTFKELDYVNASGTNLKPELFTDGAIIIYNQENNQLIDSGYTLNTLKQWIKDYVELYMSTTTIVDDDGGEIIEMTVADNLMSEKDGILEIGG